MNQFSIDLSIQLFIYLSIYPTIHPAIDPSIHLSILINQALFMISLFSSFFLSSLSSLSFLSFSLMTLSAFQSFHLPPWAKKHLSMSPTIMMALRTWQLTFQTTGRCNRDTPWQVKPVKNRMPTGMFPQKWVQHIWWDGWLLNHPRLFCWHLASWKFENPRLKLSFVEVNYSQPCPTDMLVNQRFWCQGTK